MAGQATALNGGHVSGFGATKRTDNWLKGPILTVLGLATFLVYSTWAAFQGEHYFVDPYLSPMYSPVLFTVEGVAGGAPLHHAWFGVWPDWLNNFFPSFMPKSPAFLILVFPGLFRFTCYYYRKAYYRSFVGTPPGCAVGPIRQKKYRGETALLIFQNLHRYALYMGIVFIVILTYDAIISFSRNGELGIGVGSIIITMNACLLACYTFGCHSWRHIIGGKLNCFSCDSPSRFRHGAWKKSSWLNARHMHFAWISLFWVMFTDFYIRMVSMGIFTDFNTWGN